MMLQRDSFIKQIQVRMATNEDIYFLSADFGAAQLDELRHLYPSRFIHCGISEQNMIDLATGLALDGNQVFCYAMAPFLSLRALEQIKCGPALMNLPITLISVGIGLGYADSGPTHYVAEDFACLRSIARCSIYTIPDSVVASKVADHILDSPHFTYVRLDRSFVTPIDVPVEEEFWRRLSGRKDADVAIVTHGRTCTLAMDSFHGHQQDVCVYDLIRAEPFPLTLIESLSRHEKILVVDEQSSRGGLMSAVHEALSEAGIFKKIKQVALPHEFVFENGGRDKLLSQRGFSASNLISQVKSFG